MDGKDGWLLMWDGVQCTGNQIEGGLWYKQIEIWIQYRRVGTGGGGLIASEKLKRWLQESKMILKTLLLIDTCHLE